MLPFNITYFDKIMAIIFLVQYEKTWIIICHHKLIPSVEYFTVMYVKSLQLFVVVQIVKELSNLKANVKFWAFNISKSF
jgi:hypothetical protein